MTMRILVIEDEARTADFIERGLKERAMRSMSVAPGRTD
jgi:DNA-binding response OmpR family regulator